MDQRWKWMCAETPEDSLRYVRAPVREHSELPALKREPFVSVVIPNWNAKDFIEACLNALRKSTYSRFEAIVVDNGSEDGSAEIVEKGFPEVRLIRNARNLGFSRACNQGFRASKGEVVLFLNADTEVSPDWIEPLLEVFDSKEDAALVGSRLVFPDRRTIQAEGGLFVANGLAIHPRAGTKAAADDAPVSQVLYGAGAALAARREVLEWFGGFDEGYSPAYFEDTDLALKVHRLGLRSYIARRSVVIHHESYATKKASADFCYLYHRSRFRFVTMHFNTRSLLFLWPKAERYWYETAGRDVQREALKKAYREFAVRFPAYLPQRFALARRLRSIAERVDFFQGS